MIDAAVFWIVVADALAVIGFGAAWAAAALSGNDRAFGAFVERGLPALGILVVTNLIGCGLLVAARHHFGG